MILLYGLRSDPPLELVRRRLEKRGAPLLFLDQDEIGEIDLDFEYKPSPSGTICFGSLSVAVEDIGAMYVRPYDFRQLPGLEELGPSSREWKHAAIVEDMLWGFADSATCLVLNRPSAMMSNGSKPYQCSLIAEEGFAIPPTMITTDPAVAEEYWGRHGQVIYKSLSGVRSIVRCLTEEHRIRLDNIRWCPTQLQGLVDGLDYRVHVVKGDVFACTILSDEVDYRYAHAVIEACILPDRVAECCVRLARRLDLGLCGIDLRRTPLDEWVCFEVNPSPAYSCYERATDQSISQAVAELLVVSDRGTLRAAPMDNK
jgi:hypothetical protein